MRALQGYGRWLGLALFCAALLVILPQCLLFPESGFVGEPAANQKPIVRITGGVLLDSVDTDARIHFYWFGADNDGVIRWFEWAIDDTISEDGWHRTTAYDAIIPFQASDQQDGTTEFSGWHTFYIRSVDNDYVRSRADKQFFNAHTIAPRSEILSPTPR